MKAAQGLQDALQAESGGRMIDTFDQRVGRGVDFEDGVVHAFERRGDGRHVHAGGVGEHRDLRGREIGIPQFEGVVDDAREFGIEGGLSVAREGDGIDPDAVQQARGQLVLQRGADFGCRGQDLVFEAVLVPAALAVDAVESAEFAPARQEVDAERGSQPAAVDGAENRFFAYHPPNLTYFFVE